MKKNPVSKGIISNKLEGVGEVSRAAVEKRARELAKIEGRAVPNDDDHARARRELSGGSDIDRRQEQIESLPESARWDPVPGSTGREHLELPNEDEDDEERNESAQLVSEGVEEAELDQMVQAEDEAEASDRREVEEPRDRGGAGT
jgi:hypothetical protein